QALESRVKDLEEAVERFGQGRRGIRFASRSFSVPGPSSAPPLPVSIPPRTDLDLGVSPISAFDNSDDLVGQGVAIKAGSDITILQESATGRLVITNSAAGAAHAILDGGTSHTDSVADGVTRGSIIIGNSTPKWDELVLGATKTYLRSDGTDPAWSTIASSEVLLPVIGSPTYTHVEEMNTLFHSTGWFSGGAISDAGGATVDVAAGTGALRSADTSVTQLLLFDWAGATGQAITNNSIRYVGVAYTGGSPAVTIRTTDNFDDNTDFLLGTVVNESGTLHIQNAPWKIGDHANAMIQRSRGTAPIARDKAVGGLIFSETGTRNVVVSTGALWHGLTSFTVSALNTDPGGAADTFTTYSAGGQEATGVAAWPNTQYDSSGTLTNMDTNRWANLWWYLELDGELVMVYGTAQYTSEARAGEEAVPSTLPNRLQVHGILAARFIFQKSGGTAAAILSSFDTPFSVLGVTDHDNLAGVSTDDHHAQAHASADHTIHGSWKVLYTDGSGDEIELPLQTEGAMLRSTGGTSAPMFSLGMLDTA
ncbi:hypothetical protein LCGC14_2393900, partial [marine sediment metagenome]